MTAVAAVDLGASSGRVIVGQVDGERLELHEVNRFTNEPIKVAGTLHWDILALYRGVLEGLAAAGRTVGKVDSVGIDSWAIDYGLLDADGALLGNPVHYRDGRTDGVVDRVLGEVPPDDIYGVTGIQFLPFNTLYQLVSAAGSLQMEAARQLLLIPDLLVYWLTGVVGAEVTNASTTQLLDIRSRTWASDLMKRVGIDSALFPALREPGQVEGELLPHVLDETGLPGPVAVTTVGSHDTASAVVGVPATSERFAYISSGTWSLVGVELDAPVLTEASRRANFTNELGVDGTVRYLRNVMGLWLLQESLRTWQASPAVGHGRSPLSGHTRGNSSLDQQGLTIDLAALIRRAAEVPALRSVVDPDDPAFLPPGDMPTRIAAACRETGQPEPASRPETVRCILDSLALAYRRTVRAAQELSGREVEVVHVVGGGARNELLCQLTADACALPVHAGPVEATAIGNVLVQARAIGAVSGGLGDLRDLVSRTQGVVRYEPARDDAAWRAAERRIYG
jgi:rhamnulokinase